MGNKLCRTENTEKLSINELYTAIYDGVLEANSLVLESHVRRFEKYFDKNENNEYIPKTIKIKVDDSIKDVPIISLMEHNSLKIENTKITLKTNIKTGKDCFSVNNKESNSTIEINIKANETPENISRILESMQL